MRLLASSSQRTYRYVRLAIVGAVLALFLGLGAVLAESGEVTSFSALYYTPGRDVFVGVLVAVSLALVALSGRSLEQALLDYAALFAPLIAIVPTPLYAGDVAGMPSPCVGSEPCVPPEYAAGVGVGMVTFLALAFVGVLAAVVIARVQGTLTIRTGLAVGGAGAIAAAVAVWWTLAPDAVLASGHVVFASAFFVLIAAVAARAAWASHPARLPGRSRTSCRRFRAIYAVVAGGILLALVVLLAVVLVRSAGARGGGGLVLVAEAVILVLFAAFWLAQTIQTWRDPDPASRAPGIS